MCTFDPTLLQFPIIKVHDGGSFNATVCLSAYYIIVHYITQEIMVNSGGHFPPTFAPTLQQLCSRGESLTSVLYSSGTFSADRYCHQQFPSYFSAGPLDRQAAIPIMLLPLMSHLRWESATKGRREPGRDGIQYAFAAHCGSFV